MRKIAIANQKGGTGKTTATVNLAAGLAKAGKRVLVIDADPQGNATFALLGAREIGATLYDVLTSDKPLAEAIVSVRDRLDLLPSDIDLAGAEIELAGWGGTVLDNRIEAAGHLAYDYVLIDCPPSLGLLTLNALAASKEIIVVLAPGAFSLKGLARLEDTIANVKSKLGKRELHIFGVLLNLTDNTRLCEDVRQALQARYGPKLLSTVVPRSVRLNEAAGQAVSIFEHAPGTPAAVAFESLTKEVMQNG